MVEKKKEYKYHSLSLPVYFIDEINKHIRDYPEYRSVAAYAQEAMLEKMKREKNQKKSDWMKRFFTTQSDDHSLEEAIKILAANQKDIIWLLKNKKKSDNNNVRI